MCTHRVIRPSGSGMNVQICAAAMAAVLWCPVSAWWAGPATAAELLPGEFGDVDLGRTLIEPASFPTIRTLREAVRKPEITSVLTMKLYESKDNCHVPVWSGDGQGLAFQRCQVRATSSKLLRFASLSQTAPILLGGESASYDYMFRWGVNNPASFTFARIDPGKNATRVYFSSDGTDLEEKTPGSGRHQFPALYRRTDGIWRLVYEQEGQLMHQAWNDEGPIEPPVPLARGTTPRWSRDGSRLMMTRERSQRGQTAVYEMILRDLVTDDEVVLSAGGEAIVRSPSWSPDERLAAFYVRERGNAKPWRIRVCSLDKGSVGRTVGDDVVVNLNFESEEPAWEPSSRRVWFFSNKHQRQAYHPIVAADVRTGEFTLIEYPECCTTPGDLAINPATAVPEVVFVGHDGLPRDLFVVFLNHY